MKLLIITNTHGDEQFAESIIKQLKNQYFFDWIKGNPQAAKKNIRYVETDLNRSGPGDPCSKFYEERRAYRVIRKAKQYDEVIDIHGTISNTGIFIILSDPNWKNIELAKKFDINNVILWPSLRIKGPLTQFIPSSLEIECGPKDQVSTSKKLYRILKAYLSRSNREVNQNFFIVSGILKGSVKKKMKDFKPTVYKRKFFYPLMVDQYIGIKCYMLQKLGNTLENT